MRELNLVLYYRPTSKNGKPDGQRMMSLYIYIFFNVGYVTFDIESLRVTFSSQTRATTPPPRQYFWNIPKGPVLEGQHTTKVTCHPGIPWVPFLVADNGAGHQSVCHSLPSERKASDPFKLTLLYLSPCEKSSTSLFMTSFPVTEVMTQLKFGSEEVLWLHVLAAAMLWASVYLSFFSVKGLLFTHRFLHSQTYVQPERE